MKFADDFTTKMGKESCIYSYFEVWTSYFLRVALFTTESSWVSHDVRLFEMNN